MARLVNVASPCMAVVARTRGDSAIKRGMSDPQLRVLLIDDDRPFCLAMAKALRRRGFAVRSVHDGPSGVEALLVRDHEVAVLDLRMPGMDGLSVLRATPSREAPVIVLTGHGTVPDAVEAMRLGAYTFITKPVDATDLAPILSQAARPQQAEGHMVGQSAVTRQLRSILDRLAGAAEPVMLTGETGTGKEVAARYLHAQSPRASEAFVAVNMACLPSALVESELFGHAKGAFTGADRTRKGLFELTGRGTLFLDEIGDLPLEHQAKLLRVIETHRFRPVGGAAELAFEGRLVAATHKRLADEVAAGRFREDLYYRLQVLPIELPPMRARLDDVVPIARYWIDKVSKEPLRLTDCACQTLLSHQWPGNAREIANLARRVALFAENGRVDGALVERMLTANPFGPQSTPTTRGQSPGESVEEISLEAVERRHIMKLLARHQNVTRVARILEINRRTLQRKLRSWGIEVADA